MTVSTNLVSIYLFSWDLIFAFMQIKNSFDPDPPSQIPLVRTLSRVWDDIPEPTTTPKPNETKKIVSRLAIDYEHALHGVRPHDEQLELRTY